MNNWTFKIIIAGAGGVGKTALIQRYVDGTFAEDHKMTIGAQFSKKDIMLERDCAVLQIWDFAGEERFRFMLGDYCRGASGALVCYDVSDYSTFEQIQEWLKIIRVNAFPTIPIILVGNKYDLDNKEVDVDVANQYSKDAKCVGNVMCSSKLDLNVEETFEAIAQWMIHNSQC